jgi:hypothetical protein
MLIQNVTLTTTDVQYSVDLPKNATGFSIQCRTAVAIRWAMVTGKVAVPAAPYMTLASGARFDSPGSLDLRGSTAVPVTLYFAATSGAAPVVEVISY